MAGDGLASNTPPSADARDRFAHEAAPGEWATVRLKVPGPLHEQPGYEKRSYEEFKGTPNGGSVGAGCGDGGC